MFVQDQMMQYDESTRDTFIRRYSYLVNAGGVNWSVYPECGGTPRSVNNQPQRQGPTAFRYRSQHWLLPRIIGARDKIKEVSLDGLIVTARVESAATRLPAVVSSSEPRTRNPRTMLSTLSFMDIPLSKIGAPHA